MSKFLEENGRDYLGAYLYCVFDSYMFEDSIESSEIHNSMRITSIHLGEDGKKYYQLSGLPDEYFTIESLKGKAESKTDIGAKNGTGYTFIFLLEEAITEEDKFMFKMSGSWDIGGVYDHLCADWKNALKELYEDA